MSASEPGPGLPHDIGAHVGPPEPLKREVKTAEQRTAIALKGWNTRRKPRLRR